MTEAEKIVEGLDPGQRACVEHGDGPLLVTAVAGAGKTTAIVHRVEYLAKVRKVDPARILAVTFSKKGADEMATRLEKRGVRGPRVGTFHSLAWEIVRKESSIPWTIDESGRFPLMVKQVTGYQGLRWEGVDHDLVLAFIGLCKAWLAEPGSDRAADLADELDARVNGANTTNPEKMLEAYERAEDLRRDAKVMTYDDQLVEACAILKDDVVRRRWASRWEYVIQDEAQDQSFAQWILGDALAKDHRNYVLVGDRQQMIFQWRGADATLIPRFLEEYKASEVTMDRTYRCGSAIVEVANEARHHLHVPPMVAGGSHTGTVHVFGSADTGAEAEEIVNTLELHRASGVPLRELAVLYRTGEQSQPIEDRLIARKIPYRVMGGISFFERKEVLNVLSYLRLAAGRGGVEDVKRSLRAPFRYLSAKVLDRVAALTQDPALGWREIGEKASEEQRVRRALLDWAGLVDDLSGFVADEPSTSPGRVLQEMLARTNFVAWLKKEEGEDTAENQRVRNVHEVVRIASKFATADEFLAYVNQTVKAAVAARARKSGDAVVLSTIHRSKGLEWDVVAIAGLQDGIFPHSRADLHEERRLLYVAVTRARHALYLSGLTAPGGDGETPRFIRELGYGR